MGSFGQTTLKQKTHASVPLSAGCRVFFNVVFQNADRPLCWTLFWATVERTIQRERLLFTHRVEQSTIEERSGASGMSSRSGGFRLPMASFSQ
jgi:hypothetical protein